MSTAHEPTATHNAHCGSVCGQFRGFRKPKATGYPCSVGSLPGGEEQPPPPRPRPDCTVNPEVVLLTATTLVLFTADLHPSTSSCPIQSTPLSSSSFLSLPLPPDQVPLPSTVRQHKPANMSTDVNTGDGKRGNREGLSMSQPQLSWSQCRTTPVT